MSNIYWTSDYMNLDIITFVMLSVKIRNFSSHYRYIKNAKGKSDLSKPLISCQIRNTTTKQFYCKYLINIISFATLSTLSSTLIFVNPKNRMINLAIDGRCVEAGGADSFIVLFVKRKEQATRIF